ncbi:hypothetical protein AAG906_012108 [Vitis piasezkii]
MTPRFNHVRMDFHSGNARDEQALKVSYGERYEGRGHFQYECPSWEKSANYAEFDEEEEMLLINHMCGNRQWFSNIDEAFRHSVKLDNNTRMGINGSTQVVIDVYYVPTLKNNLLRLIMQTKMTTNWMFVLLANVVLETLTFGGELLENCSSFMRYLRPYYSESNNVEGEDAFSESEEEVVESIEAVVINQEVEATTPTSIESSNEVAPVQAETRIRRAPPYLQDYVTGEGLSKDADVNNLAMDVKWRRAMDLEIEATEKNET